MKLVDCFLELVTFVRLLACSEPMAKAEYDVVREDIKLLIDRMEKKAASSVLCREQFENARFAVFAWIDETILCSPWQGAQQWVGQTLQREYYGTANAGEEFYQRLGKLLANAPKRVDEKKAGELKPANLLEIDDSYTADWKAILEVYGLCLSLGYTGAYFNDKDAAKLKKLHRYSVKRIFEEKLLAKESIFPSAYSDAKMQEKNKSFGRVFDFWSLFFLILSVLVLLGIFYTYKELLVHSLTLWAG